MEHVLPAIKTKAKRKKIKPPGPWFWWFLFWCTFCIYFMIRDIVDIGMGASPLWNMIDFCVLFLCLYYFYGPRFLKEWKAWRKDNED